MSIASEITRLQNAKANIKTAIEAKGVEIPSDATLDEYSAYVEEIPSGGGSEPSGGITTLAQISKVIKEYFDYVKTIPNTYQALSNENIILYTPDEEYKNYYITQGVNGKYRVYWSPTGEVISSSVGRTFGATRYKIMPEEAQNINNQITMSASGFNFYVYRSSEMSSLEQCLTAIKSNATSYTKTSTTISWKANTDIYTNGLAFDVENDEYVLGTKISSNETIEKIS